MEIGDTAVVVAQIPRCEGDEHDVPIKTVITITGIYRRTDGPDLIEGTYYNCGNGKQVFYDDEIEVIH